ncbi:MAG: protein restricted to Verrucomicrobia-Planctomycetes group [Pedosphaera sp.]|nr:protein restricted to Verrucomicrobia-Planctomycetes group [Pedosphaera sp.]
MNKQSHKTMQAVSFEEVLDQILKRDVRYHRDAYVFIREALDFTQKTAGKEGKGQKQHVTPQELLNGIRDFALASYGPMAITLFEEWGIRSCQDFGELVFIMVEHSLLAKTDRDSRADFEGGYDFQETFRNPFLPKNKHSRKLLPAKTTRA